MLPPVALQFVGEFRERYLKRIGREFEELQSSGVIAADPARNGEFKLAGWGAALRNPRLLFDAKRYKWMGAAPGKVASEAEEKSPTAAEGEEIVVEDHSPEYYHIHRNEETTLTRLALSRQGAITFAALAVLLASYMAVGVLSPSALVMIALVLVAHELGHVVVMRLLGGRDDGVFVLPLLGRLAGSPRRRVPAWKQLAVLLAGPLPGLCFGWGLLILAYVVPGTPTFIKEFAFWCALVNNLNLLPAVPFDGGRMVNLLIFERYPGMRLIYLLVSMALLAALVLIAQYVFAFTAWPFFLLLVAAGLGIPDCIRMAKLGRVATGKLSPGEDEADAIEKAIGLVNSSSRGKSIKSRNWTDLVDRVVRKGCAKRMGLVGSVASLLVLFTALHTPAWVLIGLVVGEGVHIEAEQRKIAEAIRALRVDRSAPPGRVSRKTRENLEALRDIYQDALAQMYGGNRKVESEVFEYDERGIYDPSEALDMIRGLQWEEVAVWIAEEDTGARQATARVLVLALMGDAEEQANSGNVNHALASFARAYWGLTMCEPRSSLAAWIDWLYLENDLLENARAVVRQREAEPPLHRMVCLRPAGSHQAWTACISHAFFSTTSRGWASASSPLPRAPKSW